jgi:hypothetical protein
MKSKLPENWTCPACGRHQPIGNMTIDKVFTPSLEEIQREAAQIEARKEEYSTGKGRIRIIKGADFEHIIPKAGEALKDKIWQIRCDACDPEGDYYWFSLSECDTPAKALDWITHFNGKRWPSMVLKSFIGLMEQLFGHGGVDESAAPQREFQ